MDTPHQIDFRVTVIPANCRRSGQHRGITAAKLQRNRLLKRVKTQQPVPVAMPNGLRRHHLSIKQRMPRELAVEEPAMPVRPVHHGGNGEQFILVIQ